MADTQYLEWLERGLSKVPLSKGRERLEIPPLKIHFEGNKTIISNLNKIAEIIERDQHQVFKYLVKRLATSGAVFEERAIIKGRFREDQISSVLNEFITTYVTCPVCKRPDTRLVKGENKVIFLACSACGARVSVKRI
jgi:translation initiation factor 2 subunit 2